MGGRRPSLHVPLTWPPWPSTRELCFSFTHDPATCILPTLIKSSVFYTITIPVLNPLIYSLRNRDIKDASKKVLEPKIHPSWDIRFQDPSKSLITNSSCVYAQLCPTLCTPWTIARQTLLSLELSRQEYWSGLPFPLPGNLPHPGVELAHLVPPALAGGFFTHCATWEASSCTMVISISWSSHLIKTPAILNCDHPNVFILT